MTRLWIAALAMCSAAACRQPQPGDPLRGLSAAERARFDSGRAVFDSTFTPAVGLGPLFNASGCGECHENPVAGANGDEVENAVRVGDRGQCGRFSARQKQAHRSIRHGGSQHDVRQ